MNQPLSTELAAMEARAGAADIANAPTLAAISNLHQTSSAANATICASGDAQRTNSWTHPR